MMNYKELLSAMDDPSSAYFVPNGEFEMVSLKGFKYPVKSYRGYMLPPMCRNIEVVKTMSVRENDTFVITYPKSGIKIALFHKRKITRFLSLIVYLLILNRHTLGVRTLLAHTE